MPRSEEHQALAALARVRVAPGVSRVRQSEFRLSPSLQKQLGEDHARNPAARRQNYFEWIILHLTGDRAGNCQPRLRVVDARREDKRRTPATLLVAGLRIERQPKPDRQRLECMRELPRFVADRRAPIALVMAIPRRNLGDKLLEGIRRAARADHAVLDRHVNAVAFIDLRFERDRFRKS